MDTCWSHTNNFAYLYQTVLLQGSRIGKTIILLVILSAYSISLSLVVANGNMRDIYVDIILSDKIPILLHLESYRPMF